MTSTETLATARESCEASAVFRLTDLRWARLDIPMLEPFGIAGGSQTHAANVAVLAELDDGCVGSGEAAPFPAVNGETQALVEAAIAELAPRLVNRAFASWREFSAALPPLLATPTARTAVEMAVMDACLRSRGESLWAECGAKASHLDTDITIGTGDEQAASRAAGRAAAANFSTLKIKVGGAGHAHDVARIQAAHRAAPAADLLLDGNAAFSPTQAVKLLDALGPARAQVRLFEQPTAKADFTGLKWVEETSGVAVAADESCQSVDDLELLNGVSVINIKLMKSGVLGAISLAEAARAQGFRLMMGGMVESRLAMGCAAAIAAGFGSFDFIDLDTPLWLAEDPCSGGYVQVGPRLTLPAAPHGHGTSLASRWAPRVA